MRYTQIILCYCCVFTGHFSNGSSIHTSKIKTHLVNHTMEMIDKGFKNNSNPVIITSDLVDDQVLRGNIDNGNPVIVVNGDLNRKTIHHYHPEYPTYVITFESMTKLISLIFEFMSSTIWSIRSPIFILDISEGPHDINAYNVLGFLGNFDVLVSYYVCYNNDKNSTIVYTLNPYTQYAPLPWNNVRFPNSDSKIKPTLYSLQYPKDLKKNYQNIYFDKIQYLGDHTIKLLALVNPQNSSQELNQNEINDYLNTLNRIKDLGLNSLPDYMKVTTSIHILKNYFSIGMVKSGFDIKLTSRQYDAYNQLYQLADINYKFTDFVSQYVENHYSILTKKTDYLIAITEINININFIFITIFVLFIILLIILINNQFHVSEGIVDIVSMSLSMGIMSSLERLSMKIIYFFGFIFIFVVMPEFQGQISAILSQPARRNVETLKDLFDNKYHVFYNGLLKNDMINEKLWMTEEDQKYLHSSHSRDLEKCAIEAQQNSTIACIHLTQLQLLFVLKLKNLHISKESVFKKYNVFWTKKNWALKDKIDKARSIPVETGLLNHYDEDIIENQWKKIKKIEKIKEAENYERVDFENLVFYFIMFAAILLWSLIIFGIELIVYHNRSKFRRQEETRRQLIERLRAQEQLISSPDQVVPSTSRE